MTDSNRRHPACKAGALPTELTAHPSCVSYRGPRVAIASRRSPPKEKQQARSFSLQPAVIPGGSGLKRQTDSFNSLEARKATFFDALIWIASPVAGLRPMRAARLRT